MIKIHPKTEKYDLMNSDRVEIPIGDHGFVALVDMMPRLVPVGQKADHAIVQAARVSFGDGTKQVNEDRGLIRYLMRHRHTTPLEMVEFKFHCAMPIFVARQWIRHRTASVNEVSARYSVVKDDFYIPAAEEVRQQSSGNKQSSDGRVSDGDAETFVNNLDMTCNTAYQDYERALNAGIGREQARMLLPLNVYTEWYWKIDLHNLFHFLSLRMDAHAQKEIRDYANAMFFIIEPLVPIAAEAFLQYRLNGMQLTQLEINAIKGRRDIETDNKREASEFLAKKEILGL